MPGRLVAVVRRLVEALLLAGVVACGGDAPVIVLRMTSWQTPAENALDLPAIRAFEAAHPNVRVENEPVSNQAEYREKVITSIVSNAPPDVFLMDNIDVPAFAEAQVVLDLKPFASRVGLDLASFYPNVLDIFTRDGRVQAFPKGFSPLVYYYNRALFDAQGLSYPQDGWTWGEFVATAKALTRDLDGDGSIDQWGTALIRPFYAWQAMIWSGGGDILQPDGKSASGALDGPASIAALEFLTGLVVTHGVAPRPNAFRAVTGNETRLFY
ncbi:MAG: extracellular solute-binding protein, partial [Cytophagaceae bacterium]|nr:extracellular solute-binding protein [Gemmatimonadaceae bacterium]